MADSILTALETVDGSPVNQKHDMEAAAVAMVATLASSGKNTSCFEAVLQVDQPRSNACYGTTKTVKVRPWVASATAKASEPTSYASIFNRGGSGATAGFVWSQGREATAG